MQEQTDKDKHWTCDPEVAGLIPSSESSTILMKKFTCLVTMLYLKRKLVQVASEWLVLKGKVLKAASKQKTSNGYF